jgi:5-methylcytosine-specific restriction endonuclease McrA
MKLDMAKKLSGDPSCRNIFLKHRKRGLTISYEEFIKISSSVCYYCGSLPSNLHKYNHYTPYLYNGLDRLDPSGGYIADNIVPCCWRCNRMKSNMTHDEFLGVLRTILVRLKNEKPKDSRRKRTPKV